MTEPYGQVIIDRYIKNKTRKYTKGFNNKRKTCKKFEITRTICWNSERSEQFLEFF